MAEKYSGYSPYHFSGNNPMAFVDFDGAEFTGPSMRDVGFHNSARNPGGSTMMGTSETLAQAQVEAEKNKAKNDLQKVVDKALTVLNSNESVKMVHLVFEAFTETIYKNTVNILKTHPEFSTLHYESNKEIQLKNSKIALNGYNIVPGKHRDEFPYKCSKEGGCGAFVNYVLAEENRLQGGQLSILSLVLDDGDAFAVIPVPKSKGPTNIIPIAMLALRTTETKNMALSRIASNVLSTVWEYGGILSRKVGGILTAPIIYTGSGGLNNQN